MSKTNTPTVQLTVQKWGNSLAVRIPAALARKAQFVAGQPVEISKKLTLAQRLAAFDADVHGGKAMHSGRVGAEVF